MCASDAIYKETHAGVYAFAFDANGNVSEVLDSSGGIAAHYEYSPLGEVVRSSGNYADANPYRFSTKYLDTETGVYFYGYRHYDPAKGRWLSRDPIEELGGINLYGFVFNNPVDFSDRDGRFLNFVAGAIIGAAADYAGQVAGNIASGQSLGQSLTNVSGASIAGGAALGATGVGLGAAVSRGVAAAGVRGAAGVAARAAGNAIGGAALGAGDAAVRGNDVTQGAVLGGLGGGLGSALGDAANAATSGLRTGSSFADDLVSGGTLSDTFPPSVGNQNLNDFVGDSVAAGVSGGTSIGNNIVCNSQ